MMGDRWEADAFDLSGQARLRLAALLVATGQCCTNLTNSAGGAADDKKILGR